MFREDEQDSIIQLKKKRQVRAKENKSYGTYKKQPVGIQTENLIKSAETQAKFSFHDVSATRSFVARI